MTGEFLFSTLPAKALTTFVAFDAIITRVHFLLTCPDAVALVSDLNRVRPIPCWRLIPDTISRNCTNTETDTGNDIPHSLRQMYVTYVAHTVRTFQNITPLTTAVPIPILEMTSLVVWGKRTLHTLCIPYIRFKT